MEHASLLQHRLVLVDHSLQAEQPGGSFARPFARGGSKSGVGQIHHLPGQVVGIERPKFYSSLAHHLSQSTDVSHQDHSSAHHLFHRGQTGCFFPNRRHDHDIQVRELSRERCSLQETRKANVAV
jgi:hypothetical protein